MRDFLRRASEILPVWVPVAGLGLYLLILAVATAPARYEARDLLLIAVCYGLTAAALGGATQAVWARFPSAGSLLTLPVGLVVSWHLCEQMLLPARFPSFHLVVVGAAGAFLGALYLSKRPTRLGRTLVAAALSAILLAAVIFTAYHASNTFRWHLLRHNKMLGVPTYLLLAEPARSVTERLWSERANPSGAASPSRVAPVLVSEVGELPHIIFILIDTLRTDALASYDGDPSLMPTLNRFASQSLVFDDVIANASWTRPSMGAFFTGLLPEEHGAVDVSERLSEDRWTLAESLHEVGYETVAFVANYAAVGRDAGFAQGYDEFHELDGTPDPYARAEQVVGDVAAWLRADAENVRTRPLLLYVHFVDPHDPYLSGGKGSVFHSVAQDAYERELRYLDGWLGRLFDVLGEDLEGPRFVFVTSDHGEEFGEHGDRGHGRSLYREVLSIPALLQTPGADSGRIEGKLEARDFFDVFARLGRSSWDEIREWLAARGETERMSSIFYSMETFLKRPYENYVSMRSIEAQGHTLVWSGYGSTYELYDVEKDPEQKRNLARERPNLLADLRNILHSRPERWARREPIAESEQTVKMLRALGYVE